MKQIMLEIWHYYEKMPLEKKINKNKFYKKLRRFIKKEKPVNLNIFYDFLLIQIVKKDIFKWIKYFEKNKLIF